MEFRTVPREVDEEGPVLAAYSVRIQDGVAGTPLTRTLATSLLFTSPPRNQHPHLIAGTPDLWQSREPIFTLPGPHARTPFPFNHLSAVSPNGCRGNLRARSLEEPLSGDFARIKNPCLAGLEPGVAPSFYGRTRPSPLGARVVTARDHSHSGRKRDGNANLPVLHLPGLRRSLLSSPRGQALLMILRWHSRRNGFFFSSLYGTRPLQSSL